MESTFALITAPTVEPVTLQEAKAHLRLEHDADDVAVLSAISTARQHAESYCWRGFMTQTWEFIADCFPDSIGARTYFELPRGGLVSVTSVKYIDPNGVEQTISSSAYVVDTASEPGRVRLAYGETWPDHREQWDAVRIRYVVGWTGPTTAPQNVKHAVLMLVSHLYENRTPEISGTTVSKFELAANALLQPYRLTGG